MIKRSVFPNLFQTVPRRGLMTDDALHMLTKLPLGLIYIQFNRNESIGTFDYSVGMHFVVQHVRNYLDSIQTIAGCNIVSSAIVDEHLFVLVSFPPTQRNLSAHLYDATFRFKQTLQMHVSDTLQIDPFQITYLFGTSLIRPNTTENPEVLFYRGVFDAINQARLTTETSFLAEQTEFLDIIQNHRIRTVYQPIVSLWTGEVFGFEALTRGPVQSQFVSPVTLFNFAEGQGLLCALEEVAIRNAIEHFDPSLRQGKLFLNVNASMFLEKDFVVDQMLAILNRLQLKPHEIVLEVTERRSIDDFSLFNRTLHQYRQHGYLIAIDDLGSGYSSLQTLAELKPDFIKIDRSLIHRINEDKVKQSLVQALCQTALMYDCKVIAEGIETYEELALVSHIGATYGQGYFLGYPSEVIEPISDEVLIAVRRAMTADRMTASHRSIGQIAAPVQTFNPSVESREIVEYFHQNEHATGAIIVEGAKPLGLVMREKLFRKLATKYGVSLFWNRSISEVMDRQPLILDENVSVENASVLSMGRHADQLYDLIIVTREGDLVGAVTIQDVLNTITHSQIELARDANPLTGLPGNTRIELEVSKRISSNQGFSVIYIDLDHFKGFNDAFGFHTGDQAIRILAESLRQAISLHQSPDHFVGHIGGDDFILLTIAGEEMQLANTVQSIFEVESAELCALAGNADWVIRDRAGRLVETKSLTLSISIVTCVPPMTGLRQEQVSLFASELKQKAKRQGGNQIVADYYHQMNEQQVDSASRSVFAE